MLFFVISLLVVRYFNILREFSDRTLFCFLSYSFQEKVINVATFPDRYLKLCLKARERHGLVFLVVMIQVLVPSCFLNQKEVYLFVIRLLFFYVVCHHCSLVKAPV